MSARKRTFDPQAQVAGSVANSSTWFSAPQMLQVKATTQSYFVTAQTTNAQKVIFAASCRILGSNVVKRDRNAALVAKARVAAV